MLCTPHAARGAHARDRRSLRPPEPAHADVGDIEKLAQKVFTDVGELVLLSPDIADGVWTTHEMLEIDQAIADDAAALAARLDPHFDADRRRQAIAQLEADRTAQKGEPFRLSAEQRAALSHNGGLTVLLGKPGVGKTTIMETLRREADVVGRKIYGITVAQAAAIRLEVAAGFRCVNSAFALVGDHPRRELIPRDGILVLDEAPMMDNRTVRAIVALARDRNTVVVALGDHRQIQSIGPGGAWHILAAAAKRAGTFSELNEIRRQARPWHLDAVNLVGDAIETKRERTFETAVDLLVRNGALNFVATKDEAISQIVSWYTAERKISEDVLLVATDRDTVRYLNEELLSEQPGRPAARNYLTDGGIRNLAVGDRFIFGENSGRIGVVNGDTGRVVETGGIIIGVQIDRTGGIVKFDSRRYDKWDHGYATTVMRAQGASVRALGGIVDSAATAEVFNVLVSRSASSLRALVPKTAFADAHDLAGHLASHIVAKGTTQDIFDLVASRGGVDSFYAMNLAAQRMSAANPMRQAYEAEWSKMRADRERELRETAHTFRRRRIGVDDPAKLKSLRLEQRQAEARIVKAYQPEDFGAWAFRHTERETAIAPRLEALQLKRSQQPEIKLAPEVSVAVRTRMRSRAAEL